MIKKAPSAVQVAFMAAFAVTCFALLLWLWISFGGSSPLAPKGYRITVRLPDAGQLQPQADVRISGVTVGRVISVRHDPRSHDADAVIQVDAAFAPRPTDSRALLRQKSLLGETYLALSPGSPRAPKLRDGGVLGPSQVEHAVTFGELLSTFDAPSRRSFGIWMTEQGAALAATGQALNAAIGQLGPFAQRTDDLVALVDQEGAATRRLIGNGGVVLNALAAQPGRLRSLVRSVDAAFAATAQQDRELAATVSALGPFLRQSRVTLDRLARFGRNTRPLTDRLVPVARSLHRVLRDAPGSAVPLRRLLDAAPELERASARGVPATVAVLRRSPPLLARLRTYLGQLVPFLDYAGRYRGELAGSLGNLAAATQSTLPGAADGKPLHLLRAVATLNPASLAAYRSRLETDRTNPYAAPGSHRRLASGLPSWPSGCGTAPLPTLADSVPAAIRDLAQRFFLTDRRNVACSPQPPLGPTVGHGDGAFPQVTALP